MSRFARASVVALALGALVACDGRPKTVAATSAKTAEPRSGAEVAVLDLTDGLPEVEAVGLLGVPVHRASFDRFLRAVHEVSKDTDVKGVFIKLGSTSMGLARAQEVGELLEPLRASKPVYCHADALSNATLLAAARGCSKIWVSPAGDVESIGLAIQLVYLHKLLAEELHITVDFLQVGKYKGAEEEFTRDGPSDEARQSVQSTLSDLRTAWIEGIRKGRGRDDAGGAAEDGPFSPLLAKGRGLIDEVGYVDDALADARKAAGAVRDEVRFGRSAAHQDDGLSDIVRVLAGTRSSVAPIALLRESGSIVMAPGGGLMGGDGGITEREMGKLLARVEKDEAVKAVVIRIDSPGGSALASDLLWHAVRKVRAKKPVVVSVAGMAASGGYYISSAASQIVAEPTSILGSIGVVGGKFAFGDALGRIGVHAETISASGAPGAAARAAASSAFSGWDDATRARMLETMTGIYDLFLARVAEGRGTTTDKIAPFAEGRLFGGARAKENGLVDEIGGLDVALAKARSLAGLPADAAFSVVASRAGFLDVLDSAAGDDEPDSAKAPLAQAASALEASPSQALERVAPELVPYVGGLGALASGERALTAVPFAVLLR